MTGRSAVALAFAALLLVAPGASAYHEEVRLDRATLYDVRAALLGDLTRPGLVSAGKHFKASFRDVVLTGRDASMLRQIVQDAASLPPDSRLTIQGAIDGKPFEVHMRSDEKGHKEAKLEGMMFADRHEALSFLESLRDRGMREAKLRGSVEGQRIEGRIEDGKPRFEG
jgi:hypothetical protein